MTNMVVNQITVSAILYFMTDNEYLIININIVRELEKWYLSVSMNTAL